MTATPAAAAAAAPRRVPLDFLAATGGPLDACRLLYKELGLGPEIPSTSLGGYDQEQVWAMISRVNWAVDKHLGPPDVLKSSAAGLLEESDDDSSEGQGTEEDEDEDDTDSDDSESVVDQDQDQDQDQDDKDDSQEQAEDDSSTEDAFGREDQDAATDSDDDELDAGLAAAKAAAAAAAAAEAASDAPPEDDADSSDEPVEPEIDFMKDLSGGEPMHMTYADFFAPMPRELKRSDDTNRTMEDLDEAGLAQFEKDIQKHADLLEDRMGDDLNEKDDLERLTMKMRRRTGRQQAEDDFMDGASSSSDEDDYEDNDMSQDDANTDNDASDSFGQEPEDESALSSFQQRQKRLRDQIHELEQKSLQPKAWQMAGEISANLRPRDALLEEDLDFDPGKRPPPKDTPDRNERIEAMIKSRILAKNFDDVIRKVSLHTRTRTFDASAGKGPEQSKSERSLAQIYEDEYMKKMGVEQSDKYNTELKAQHDEIREIWAKLSVRLDAMCSFRPMPTDRLEEASVVEVEGSGEGKAMMMEEILPAPIGARKDQSTILPTKVHKKTSKDLKDLSERTTNEKARLRQRKKKAIRGRFDRAAENAKLLADGKRQMPSARARKVAEELQRKNVRRTLKNSGVDVKMLDRAGREVREGKGTVRKTMEGEKKTGAFDVRFQG